MPIPSAIEKVNGIDITVKDFGITSVISPQSINFIPKTLTC